MNIMKRDIDLMMDTIRLLSKRGTKPLTQEEKDKIAQCTEIYNKCIADHEKSIAYRKAYRIEKQKEDPLYSRPLAYRKKKQEQKEEDPQ